MPLGYSPPPPTPPKSFLMGLHTLHPSALRKWKSAEIL